MRNGLLGRWVVGSLGHNAIRIVCCVPIVLVLVLGRSTAQGTNEPEIPKIVLPGGAPSAGTPGDKSRQPVSTEPEIPTIGIPQGDTSAQPTEAAQPTTSASNSIFSGLALNKEGVLAGLLVAGICSFIGVYVVLKRIVFVGASLAQISSAGIALAFLLGQSIPYAAKHPLAISLVVTLIGVLIYSQQTLSRKIPQESIIGIGYLIASALTLMFIVRSPKGMEDVRELLDGNIITVRPEDLTVMAIVFAAVALVHILFYKQFLFVSFDREVAATQGFKPRMWELLFYLVLGITISVAIQFAGLLAVFAYLVIPAVTGLLVARRMPTAFVVAILSALFSTVIGFIGALGADLPTSPPTIAVMSILLGLVWVSRRFVREV